MAVKNLNFEASMARLVEISERLESGAEPLEASLKLFEEGSALAAACYQKLELAQQRVREITTDKQETENV